MFTRDRIGIEPRRQARQRTRQVLLTRPIVLGTAAVMAFLVALWVGARSLVNLTGHGWNPTVFGFVLGAFVISVPWATWTSIVLIDGSWSWRVGAVAERRTAEVLQQLGPAWRHQHNMVFYGGRLDAKRWVSDIDCVTIGPGGVYAVSTKWTGDHWDLTDSGDPWLIAAARQAATNAGRLDRQVRQIVADVPVIPVVVCWGPQLDRIPKAVTHIDVDSPRSRVRIVNGYQSEEWRPKLEGNRLEPDAVSRIDAVVADWIDHHESRHRRSADSRAHLQRLMHRAGLACAASAAVSAVVTVWWIVAAFDRSVLKSIASAARLGGGSGAMAILLAPLVPSAAAAIIRRRLDLQGVRAGLPLNRVPALLALGSVAAFVATFIASLVFG